MEKYYNDNGEVAVLVSPEFGAGWSTWADTDNKPESWFAMDKTLVELKLADSDTSDVEKYIYRCGVDSVYMGGWSDVVVKWLPKGTVFKILEYDGYESIQTIDDLNLSTA